MGEPVPTDLVDGEDALPEGWDYGSLVSYTPYMSAVLPRDGSNLYLPQEN